MGGMKVVTGGSLLQKRVDGVDFWPDRQGGRNWWASPMSYSGKRVVCGWIGLEFWIGNLI